MGLVQRPRGGEVGGVKENGVSKTNIPIVEDVAYSIANGVINDSATL
jgi:hypothetical protein